MPSFETIMPGGPGAEKNFTAANLTEEPEGAAKKPEEELENKENNNEEKEIADNAKLREEYNNLKQQVNQIKQAKEALLADDEGNYNPPDEIKFNEKGELINITVNGIKEGYGKLGKILKDRVPAGEGESRKPGEINDKYIVEAYNNNPQVREILDKYFELDQQEKEAWERMRSIEAKKVESYKQADELNKLLKETGLAEVIGSETRAEDEKNEMKLDLGELAKAFDEIKAKLESAKTLDSETAKELNLNLEKLNKLLEKFDTEFNIADEIKANYEVDLKALSKIFSELVRKAYEIQYSLKDKSQPALISSKAGKGLDKFAELVRA